PISRAVFTFKGRAPACGEAVNQEQFVQEQAAPEDLHTEESESEAQTEAEVEAEVPAPAPAPAPREVKKKGKNHDKGWKQVAKENEKKLKNRKHEKERK